MKFSPLQRRYITICYGGKRRLNPLTEIFGQKRFFRFYFARWINPIFTELKLHQRRIRVGHLVQ